MDRKKDGLIFLTGCINPNGMIFTALQDPEIRKEQYLSAIKYYLKNTNKRILFVENSDNDISNYFPGEIKNNELEALAFNGNSYNKLLGKGYGEMLIIEYALKHSSFIREADFIYKITGRLKVLNINAIMKQVESNSGLEVLVNFQQNLTYTDSKFWGAKKRFFSDILIAYKDKINDSMNIHFENVLSKAVHQAIIEDYKFQFITNLPRYSGVQGSENKKINDSLWSWLPLFIKHKIRLNTLRK